MKYEIIRTSQFKKDYKTAVKRGLRILTLYRTGSHRELF